MKLEKITLKNYRSFKEKTFYFNGDRLAIEGENGKGKTSIIEGLFWLLTGGILKSGANSDIKPLDAPIDAIVEARGVFTLANKKLTISRQLKPIIKDDALVGNETITEINGINYEKQKDFIAELEKILKIDDINTDLNIIKMCVNPLYLADLCEGGEWQGVRRFIEQLANSNGFNVLADIEPIKTDLENYDFDIEKVKKFYRSSIKALTLQETSEKGKIEYLKSLPRVSREEKERADSLLKMTNNNPLTDEKNTLNGDLNALNRKIELTDLKIENLTADLNTLEDERKKLLADIKALKPISVCPICHHRLTESEQKEIVESKKADIVKIGKKKRSQIEKLKTDIDKLLEEVHNLVNLKKQKQEELEAVLNKEKATDSVNTNTSDLMRIITDYERQEENDEKLADLKNKVQEFSKQILSFKQRLAVANNYYIKQADLLDNAQTKLFGKKYFRFIKQNISGNYEPFCKLLYDEKVPYASCSQSEKIRLGIELIESLRKLIDLPLLPILFDEGGEISKETFSKIKTDAQIICVRVSDEKEIAIINL